MTPAWRTRVPHTFPAHGPAQPRALGTTQLCSTALGSHFTQRGRQQKYNSVKNVEPNSPQRRPLIYRMEDDRKARASRRWEGAWGVSHARERQQHCAYRFGGYRYILVSQQVHRNRIHDRRTSSVLPGPKTGLIPPPDGKRWCLFPHASLPPSSQLPCVPLSPSLPTRPLPSCLCPAFPEVLQATFRCIDSVPL